MSETVGEWVLGTVCIATPDGLTARPAIRHKRVVGLAVGMPIFGIFRVTHVISGRAIGPQFERAGSAAVLMAKLALVADALGFSWLDAGAQSIEKQVNGGGGDQPVPFGGATTTQNGETRPMTIREWLRFVVHNPDYIEFPWESPDEDPWLTAEGILGLTTPTPDTEAEDE